jgi:hypothetical protein
MYESVAGVWTERIRVFVGEAISNGSSVTTLITYALNGQYRSPNTAIPIMGTLTNLSHNIGTNKINSWVKYICLTAEHNYAVGDLVSDIMRLGDSSSISRSIGSVGANHTRLTMWVVRGDAGEYIFNKNNGTVGLITAANWAYIFMAERSY